MVMDQTHKFCSRCGNSTMHYRKGTNHILHLLLTVLLCGWWLPVWLLLSLKIGGWRCQVCGYRGSPVAGAVSLLVCAVGFMVTVAMCSGVITSSRDAGRSAANSARTEMDATATPEPTNSPTPETDTTDTREDEPASTSPEPPASEPKPQPQPQPKPRPTADLIIEGWRFSTESGFVKVAGQVTNNTGQSLENVTAVVTFKTADGGFVKTSEALISYNPVLAGQTSPFEVMDTGNPAIETANLSFKHLLGGSISSMTREDLNKPTPEELEAKRRAAAEAARAKAEAEARKKAEIEAAKWRTWTSANGQFQMEGKFVRYAAGKMTLEKKDGTTLEVQLDQLCPEDQEFVKKRKWRNP